MTETLPLVRQHLERLSGGPRFGDCAALPEGFWPSALDPATGAYPEEDPRDDDARTEGPVAAGCAVRPGQRVYRYIDAPRGCALYWDQPSLVAAMHAGPALRGAALRYIRDYMARCTAANGVLLWGNHYYFDAARATAVRFAGDHPPEPADFAVEDGHLHELRPMVPAWDLFAEADAGATERYLRAALPRHLFDRESGGFNRHADGRRGCAFLESGGVLVETCGWFHRRTGDAEARELGRRLAAFSHAHRGARTGLLENNPTESRWDKWTATTECGLWAGCLLRAARTLDAPELADMAAAAVDAYLRYGWEPETGRLRGRLRVADGLPDPDEKTTAFQPGAWSDPLEPLFPAHDYPYAFMETCLDIHRARGGERYRTVAAAWLDGAADAILSGGRVVYAEHYGRAIHLAARLTREAGVDRSALANRLIRRAVERLWTGSLFVGRDGAKTYAAVDGVGYLLLALLDAGQDEALTF